MATALDRARDSRPLKVVAVLAALLLLAVSYHYGVLQRFGDPEKVARGFRELGVWGYVVFVLAYAALQPFGVPGTPFVVAAPLIWPWPVAFALSMTGTMAASVIGFSFARFLARDWITRLIPARFRKYDESLATSAFSTVFWLRFVFWMPQWLHSLLGVSKVPFGTHFWASLAGYSVPLFALSFFGQQLVLWLKHAPPSTWLAIFGSSALLLVSVVLVRRRLALRTPPALDS